MLKKGNDRILIFSDKIFFTVDAVSNSRATRYIANSSEDVAPNIEYVGKTKHPANAMMPRPVP